MIANIAAGVTALFQCIIAMVEIVFWMNPKVHSRLFFDAVEAQKAAPIVQNAGLYNAFLAAGLIWGFAAKSGRAGIFTFFFACVAIAGVFGALTLETRSPFPLTLVVQTLPAALGLAAIWWPVSRAGERPDRT
jgi:putative membrane protein